jgi:hypothetical protein
MLKLDFGRMLAFVFSLCAARSQRDAFPLRKARAGVTAALPTRLHSKFVSVFGIVVAVFGVASGEGGH